jgi:hypothetical protein
LKRHYDVCSGDGVDEFGPDDPYLHNWTTSGARMKFNKEMKFRGWCQNFNCLYEEVMSILKDFERKCISYTGYEWEPDVPNCKEPCGILVTDINQFICDAVMERVRGNSNSYKENIIVESCNEFAYSTIIPIWEKFTKDLAMLMSMNFLPTM